MYDNSKCSSYNQYGPMKNYCKNIFNKKSKFILNRLRPKFDKVYVCTKVYMSVFESFLEFFI